MATQIGVDEVIPWQANRSIAKWKAGRTDRKWRQVARRGDRAVAPRVVAGTGAVRLKQAGRRHLQARVRAWRSGDRAAPGRHHVMVVRGGRGLAARRPLSRRRAYCAASMSSWGLRAASARRRCPISSGGAQSVVLGSNILRASTAGVALSLLSRALGRFA